LHRRLRREPGVDPGRLCVVGASFGAPFALHAAAEDAEIRCLVLVQGFADVRGTASHRLAQLWRGRLGPLAAPAAGLAASLAVFYLRPPRPEADAVRLRREQRVLLIEAQDDTIVPARSRELLRRALRRGRARTRRVALSGEHMLAGRSPQALARTVRLVERWLGLEPGAGTP
ncbi:MAG: prolyl oligopeptidase family serine peptidase, partial [Elusimicrobia bacterium]|nr:prolyl oligopeptidase family serine peptidase [Elusimicrobiota bacterium]